MKTSDKSIYDCIIIGGGPGGLMAGIYLSRFRCRIKIIDDNQSRAALIPSSHNFPLQKNGISGKEIIKRLRAQYKAYGNTLVNDKTVKIINKGSYFHITNKHSEFKTKFIILATGVEDIEPVLPNLSFAVKNGLIRHCLICDGYEVIDKKIAIIGSGKALINQAKLLKAYSSDITLYSILPHFSLADEKKLKQQGITVICNPILKVKCQNKKIISLETKDGILSFDSIYSSLGIKPRTDLAIFLGAEYSKEKLLLVNKYKRTSLPRLYAIGDIVGGLNQMCTAMSEAAIAAVDIFNHLQKNK